MVISYMMFQLWRHGASGASGTIAVPNVEEIRQEEEIVRETGISALMAPTWRPEIAHPVELYQR